VLKASEAVDVHISSIKLDDCELFGKMAVVGSEGTWYIVTGVPPQITPRQADPQAGTANVFFSAPGEMNAYWCR
jgi:hypothetical protein